MAKRESAPLPELCGRCGWPARCAACRKELRGEFVTDRNGRVFHRGCAPEEKGKKGR